MENPCVKISLNKPKNLILEDLIRPDKMYFIPIRKPSGETPYEITDGSKLIKFIPTLYYLVHVLLERQYSSSVSLRSKYSPEYVQMFSRDIEPFRSKNDFNRMWTILHSLKIIDWVKSSESNYFRVSAQAYYFKLTQVYEKIEIVEHEIDVKSELSEKFNKKYSPFKPQPKSKTSTDANTVLEPLHHQFESIMNIKFDVLAAQQFAQEQFENGAIDVGKFNTYNVSINRIINGRFTFAKCKRHYTTVALMPKELRQFVKDGKDIKLVELDYASFNAFAVYKILCTSKYKHASFAELVSFNNELDQYRKMLLVGDFYTNINEVVFPKPVLSRDDIKDIVLHKWFNGMVNSTLLK